MEGEVVIVGTELASSVLTVSLRLSGDAGLSEGETSETSGDSVAAVAEGDGFDNFRGRRGF